MAYFYSEPSRTFSEYLLVPNLSTKECMPGNVALKTAIVKYKLGEKPALELNIPVASAIMQSVSDDHMAIALAKCGGISLFTDHKALKIKLRWSKGKKI